MKCFPTAMCGLMMMLPLAAGSVYAQSSTTHAATPQSSTAGAGQSSAGPSTAGQTGAGRAGAARATATLPQDPNAPPPPAHPITAEQTKEFLDLMAYKKMEDNGWSQLIANNKERAPFIPNNVWTEVQTNLNGIDYVAILQPIYARTLSTEDAAKALEFYRTPAGKRVLQSMPTILGESVAVSQQKGQQVGREAIEKHRPEIEAAQKKYQAEHAAPTLGPGAGGPGAGGPGGAAAAPGSGAAAPGSSAAAPGSGAAAPGSGAGSGSGAGASGTATPAPASPAPKPSTPSTPPQH